MAREAGSVGIRSPGFCRCSHALERKEAAPLREAEGELLAASREERKWRVGRRAGDEHDPPSEEEAEDGADAAKHDHEWSERRRVSALLGRRCSGLHAFCFYEVISKAGLLSCAIADPSTLPATTWAFDDGQLPGQAFSIIAPT